jgi:hypothetical protein
MHECSVDALFKQPASMKQAQSVRAVCSTPMSVSSLDKPALAQARLGLIDMVLWKLRMPGLHTRVLTRYSTAPFSRELPLFLCSMFALLSCNRTV